MSASETTVQPEEKQIDRITAELLRAKARQRVVYLFIAAGLLSALIFALGFVAYSNATRIEVAPEEAQMSATLSVVDGFAATIGHTVYALSGRSTVEISAAGFRSLRKTLQSTEAGRTIRVELSELPGELQINTLPGSEHSRWLIDGQLVAIAAALKHEVVAADHVVEIDNPYYQKKSLPVTLQRGKMLKLNVDLQPLEGELKIDTQPAGARIEINGDPVGISPLRLLRSGGSYQIGVSHDDYQSITENIEITSSEQRIERDYRLALKEAVLHIDVAPSGGKLLLNGKSVSPAAPLAVKAGVKNTLIYLKDGYFSQQKRVTVAAGEEKRASFSLKAEMGKVSFFSTPSATVNLDGKDIGQTPLQLVLPAVAHRLLVHKKGYRSFRKTLTPSSKAAQQVRVTLQTKMQARLAESPQRYTNAAGIALKLFKPDSTFVMGAPRHEKGQRANEFLRTVKLSMPFYVSTHEVSRAQYGRFRPVQGAGNEPVTSISWIEAALYCNWLSQQEKKTPFYTIRGGQLQGSDITSDGYRLVSEAEWEWLARKAAKTKQSRFTWGDDTTIPPKAGNISDEHAKGKTTHYVPNYSDGFATVAPIGSFPAELMGLYDLTGNVSEWVHDVYTLVPGSGQAVEVDPLGEMVGDTHTVKGSNWRSGRITELRAAYREGEKTGRSDIGFRVARYVYGGENGDE